MVVKCEAPAEAPALITAKNNKTGADGNNILINVLFYKIYNGGGMRSVAFKNGTTALTHHNAISCLSFQKCYF